MYGRIHDNGTAAPAALDEDLAGIVGLVYAAGLTDRAAAVRMLEEADRRLLEAIGRRTPCREELDIDGLPVSLGRRVNRNPPDSGARHAPDAHEGFGTVGGAR